MAQARDIDTEIDALISKRHREREKTEAAQERQAAYRCSVEEHAKNEQRARLVEHRDWHLEQADRLEQTMMHFVYDHRARASEIDDMLAGKEEMSPLDLAISTGRELVA